MNHYKKFFPTLAGLVFATAFGFSFLFTKNTLDHITPFQLLGFRFALAALVFTLLYLFKVIKINLKGKNLGLLIILGLVQPIAYFTFETTGINYTTSSEAGLMISLIPIFVVILSTIFLKEKPGPKQLIFVLLSVAGVIFITLMRGRVEIGENYRGFLLLLGAVLSGSVFNILSRKLSFSFSSMEITFTMMWAGAIFFNITALIRHQGGINDYLTPLASWDVLSGVLYLGIFSSVLAFFMLNYAISKMDAIKAGVFGNMTTVIAILAGIIFRGEPFYWFQVLGSFLIILGVFGTNYLGARGEGVAPRSRPQ